jgi:hypothetical protein
MRFKFGKFRSFCSAAVFPVFDADLFPTVQCGDFVTIGLRVFFFEQFCQPMKDLHVGPMVAIQSVHKSD